MMAAKKQNGPHLEPRIIIPAGVNVWPHELSTARALVEHGCTVEFIRVNDRERETTADCLVDGEHFELKSPTTAKSSMIERNLKKASKQSDKVVFDSRRMKKIPDEAIERELRTKSRLNKSLCRVLIINRHGKVIDIK